MHSNSNGKKSQGQGNMDIPTISNDKMLTGCTLAAVWAKMLGDNFEGAVVKASQSYCQTGHVNVGKLTT